MGEFEYSDPVDMVLKQIRHNADYWGSLRAKRATVEKYLRAKGLENPARHIDNLIEAGLVHVPRKNYVALTVTGEGLI